ncbi:MAG: 30S ribosomal protein S12 methylthiotransferase RimO [Planctomycetota bacterium]|jgi:ribosomal protein S12 methylthiotransferase
MTRKKTITVGFVALGCPKNVVDSEKMLGEIVEAGFLITAEPDNADVVVVNTCGFIAPAQAEAFEAIKQAVSCKAGGSVKKVIVAGCLVERLGQELFSQVDGVDAVVGLSQRDSIAQIIEETVGSGKKEVFLERPSGMTGNEIHDDRARLLITPGHWAYLRISEGCDQRCSFCTIPAIRGRFRSKPAELVLAEAAELVDAGAVELNVIAQTSTAYGRDLKVKDGLAGLLGGLEKIAALKWIRLMYLYPAGITEALIEAVAESKKIVHYFDIPIQHINDKILKDMRRGDSKERICRLIERLRVNIPDVVLRTTVIVGFPGENDEQFAELLEFLEWARFDALGCFEYYCESGTAAAEMSGQVPEKIKQHRLEELMLTQQKIAFTGSRERIGTELVCLVDSVDNESGRGRFYGQAPDIDSICIIKNCSAKPGQFVNTKVIGAKDYDLIVEQV